MSDVLSNIAAYSVPCKGFSAGTANENPPVPMSESIMQALRTTEINRFMNSSLLSFLIFRNKIKYHKYTISLYTINQSFFAF